MKRALLVAIGCAVLLGLASCRAPKDRKRNGESSASIASAGDRDATVELLRSLSLAADCEGSRRPRSPWCGVAEGWTAGTAGDLRSSRALLGLRVPLSENADNRSAIEHRARKAALAVRDDSGTTTAGLTELVPDDDEERLELSSALSGLQGVLDGSQGQVVLGPRLYRFIAVDGTAAHALTQERAQWRFHGQYATEIRRLGDSWGVLERTRDRPWAFYVSIMTDSVASRDM